MRPRRIASALFLIPVFLIFAAGTAWADNPPIVTAPASESVNENTALNFTVTASDPDGDPINSLLASGSAITAGATFTSSAGLTSGTFSWTPTFSQAGSYTATFTASNALAGSASTAITVANVDRPPIVAAPATISGNTLNLITFSVTASDPDGDPISSFTAASLPSGATFTAAAGNTSGTFSWTPTSVQGGTYSVTFTASNALSRSATTVITVAVGGDLPPVVTAPATATGNANTLITFTVSASDPDNAITSLTASGSAITAGGTFVAGAGNTSGTFTWTPSSGQVGLYSATFTASNTLSASATTSINVTSGVDHAPVVTAPATASGPTNSLITFTLSVSDPDGDPIASLTAAPVPSGATFTVSATNTAGTFSWTPTIVQCGTFNVTFTATNALSGSATTSITALCGGDRPPVVTAPASISTAENVLLTFSASASDPDGSAITSFTASGTAIAAGGTFTANATNTSGTFSWTPTFSQAGTYSVTFTASNALSGSATTSISVGATDRAPVVTAPSFASFPEATTSSFTVTASDPDGDPIASLTASGNAITAGATFASNASNTSGTLTWTPTFAQSGSYSVTFTASNALSGSATTSICVGCADRAPVVIAPATDSGAQNALITFTVTAGDPDGDPITSLTATPLPSGATFVSNAAHTSGTFSWIPSVTQFGTFSVTFTASNALSGSATTAITVDVPDRAPVVTAPATATFQLGVTTSFAVSAADPDGDPITSLIASGTAITAGATFTAGAGNTSGTLSWAPSFSQAGSYSATFTASNSLTGTATTAITASAPDAPPIVTAPSNVVGSEGTLITFQVSASDADGDLITSLTAVGLPTGATFTSNASHTSGTFSWTPSFNQAGTYSVTFTASNALSGTATTVIGVGNVDQPPVAKAGGPYTGVANVALTLDGSGSFDPDGDPLTYAWAFGDGGTGSGAIVSHTYAAAGSYTALLTVTANGLSSTATASVTILNVFQATAFTVGGNKTTSLGSGKPYTCVQIQPVAGSYQNSDVTLASIRMIYPAGSTNQIFADPSKTAISGDKNSDGIDEIAACFTKTSMRVLFAGLPAGSNTVTVELRGDLVAGGQFATTLVMNVKSTGAAVAAIVSPNPFNPRATLTFRTTREGFARARLFDASGRSVRTLLDERSLAAGTHDVPLDGRNDAGAPLASGVYLYRVETAEGTTAGRVTLLK